MLEKIKDFLGINQYRLYYSYVDYEDSARAVKTRHHSRKAHMQKIVDSLNKDWPNVHHWMEKD